MAKKKPRSEPNVIRPDDINPHHDWKRPLQAPGHTQVDFEQRIEEEVIFTDKGAQIISLFPADGLSIANPYSGSPGKSV